MGYSAIVKTDSEKNVYLESRKRIGPFDEIDVTKYDSNGSVKWSIQTETIVTANAPDGGTYASGMSVDNSGNIYLTGYTMGLQFGGNFIDRYFLMKISQ